MHLTKYFFSCYLQRSRMKIQTLCFVCLLLKKCTARLSYCVQDDDNHQQVLEIPLWGGQCRNISLETCRTLHLTITGDDGRVYIDGPPILENSVLVVVNIKGVHMMKNPLAENKK